MQAPNLPYAKFLWYNLNMGLHRNSNRIISDSSRSCACTHLFSNILIYNLSISFASHYLGMYFQFCVAFFWLIFIPLIYLERYFLRMYCISFLCLLKLCRSIILDGSCLMDVSSFLTFFWRASWFHLSIIRVSLKYL